jgi:hypothetical protein
MNVVILSAGIACVIAGIVGGGLKAFGIEIPAFQSVRRQTLLFVFGVVLILIGLPIKLGLQPSPSDSKTTATPEKPAARATTPPTSAPLPDASKRSEPVTSAITKPMTSKEAGVEGDGMVWKDPDTGLLWVTPHNGGTEESFFGAFNTCWESRAGGYANWRLPDHAQLQKLAESSHPLFGSAHRKEIENWNRYVWTALTPDPEGNGWDLREAKTVPASRPNIFFQFHVLCVRTP